MPRRLDKEGRTGFPKAVASPSRLARRVGRGNAFIGDAIAPLTRCAARSLRQPAHIRAAALAVVAWRTPLLPTPSETMYFHTQPQVVNTHEQLRAASVPLWVLRAGDTSKFLAAHPSLALAVMLSHLARC
jgi:hypothetical protein